MEWPDTAVVEGLVCGFPTVGHGPLPGHWGIFRSCDRPAEQAFESLDHRAHNARLAGTLRRLAESESPKAIKKGAISLKQQACHVRPAAVICDGGDGWLPRMRYAGEGVLKAHLLDFSPLAGASSWGVPCRSCCLL